MNYFSCGTADNCSETFKVRGVRVE